MTEPEERAAFEAWFLSAVPESVTRGGRLAEYWAETAAGSWASWQARAALAQTAAQPPSAPEALPQHPQTADGGVAGLEGGE